VYVHELAAELGVEPRDIVDRAALAGFGLLGPDSMLTADQVTTLRRSAPGRALFGGAAPSAAASGPTAAPAGGAGAIAGPLGFAPPGSEAAAGPPPAWSPSPPPPVEPRFDETPSWEPLSRDVGLDPSTITIDSSGVHYGDPARSAPRYEPPPPEIDLSRFRDAPPPLPVQPVDHGRRRSLLIGVVGLVALVLGAQAVGRQLGLIGPGAERHCTLTTKPFEDGEGMVEELVCVDGYGDVVSREVRTPEAGLTGIEFGTSVTGATTRIIDLPEFCRGATNFEEFRTGITDQLATATSMSPVGTWYDEHDGYGEGGLGTMLETFGNAGPNPQLNDLSQYLEDVRVAVRSNSLEGARMLLAATEATHEAQLRALRTITLNQC
jgi:hypothetical protein